MRWPFTSSEGQESPGAQGLTIEPEVEIHRSPGIGIALSHLREDRPCAILDLGPALPQNVRFFSRFPCRLCIVDVLGYLAEDPDGVDRLEYAPRDVFEDLLAGGPQSYDLVLAWAVFDHLDRGAAGHLVSRLARLTRPGARLFAIVSTGGEAAMPELAFALRDNELLEYHVGLTLAPCSSRLNPAAFAQLLAGFTIDHSVVLRHGFQEYVAVRACD